MNRTLLEPLQYWVSGGPILLPIAFVCLAMWAYFFKTRRALAETIETLNHLESTVHAHPECPDEPYAILPPFATSCRPAAEAIYRSQQLDAAFDEYERSEIIRLSRHLVVLAALTAAAPLLGLLGTVTGMIDTFRAVASSSGEMASQVAAGISEALITTQFGLIVAIPGVFALARLRRLLAYTRMAFARSRTHRFLRFTIPSDASLKTDGGIA